VIDVLTGERLGYRAVETAAGGTVAQVAATAPAGLPDAEIVDVAGRWLLPG
jgi:imidazolonepropionase-like amidohydrolase